MTDAQPQEVSGRVLTTKRTRGRLGVMCLPLLIILAGFSAHLFYFRDQVTRSNFDKILEGMSVHDLHNLLGRKPDHVVKRMRMQPFNVLGRLSLTARSPSAISGVSSELTIVVVVGDMNRVVDRYEVAPQLQPWYIRQRGRC
jgi:hypothetical protein